MKPKDDAISHVTLAGVNIFEELGFDPQEAASLQAESDAQIAGMIEIKENLMTEIADWIAASHLKQAEAAEKLHVSRPRVSDVVNKKVAKFTVDTLIEMVQRIGKKVQVAVV
ncbi:helix-turn-helix domain-containing protein [Rhizobium sp. 2YAF20]|jgi:predicted XRE-type DNA-binding protein|uniref:helix-turn-helix domain-containing protein n=1 Tax=Rhizobium sp. 2YAF20 TaxID=3233027 RepID=UPI003F979AA8